VDPGKHNVELSLDGYKPFSTSVNAKAGERLPVKGMLTAIPPPTVEFSASPASIQDGQSTELKWSTQGATEVTIEGLGTVPASGSRQVSPHSTTSYTLVAKGEGQPTQKALTVTVTAVPKPSIASFAAAGPTTIQKGDRVRLEWSTENANDVSIEGIGKVDARGSREVSPSDTTSYRLIAKGPGGTVNSQPVRITVEAPKPPPVAAPAVPAVNPDIALAAAAVETFKSAYEAKNIDALQKAWPSIPGRTKDAIAGSFKVGSTKFTFNCKAASVMGDSAQATCTEIATVEGRPNTVQVTLELQKSGSVWHVVNVRASR
jgi:hypothetical protein